MAVGRDSKDLFGPVLTVNLVVCLIVLGLASWSIDKYINGEQNHPHLGGNQATVFMLMFALLGGVVGATSMLAGLLHLRSWRNDSLASASSVSVISWAAIALAFGFECKQIILGGHRGKRLKTLEAMIAISFLAQLLYLLLLHAGVYRSRYGPGYYSYGGEGRSVPAGEPPSASATSATG
ncbi:hypothetical protein Tsubulata_019366 [Turnera subulata]|uniref:Uncharacterized protein n=1 Tax=Turnera subulata TaxID=218843 RepID=A0A9Q0GJM3_9ROSI|nr:hypothetical protein Tsubulata_019366 [Turnera subulata]